MKVGSLFTGIGGFDLAAERAGMEIAWQSEIDPYASKVLARHWPDTPNLGDIHGVADEAGRNVDLLVGGFPCQSYSVAGGRGGLADDRGALWWEFHRLIREGQPAWVVGENVPGLLSSAGGRDFATIIRSLVQLGYGVVWRVLDAQYFGVAQRRRRVFIVGHSGGRPRPEVLALAEGLSGDSAPGRSERTVASALTVNSAGGGGGVDDNTAQANHLVTVGPLTSGMWRGPRGTEAVDSKHLVESKVGVRRLTPLETERLQGFPDGWTDIPGMSDRQRYRQTGNAVAVPVAEWIMRQMRRADG